MSGNQEQPQSDLRFYNLTQIQVARLVLASSAYVKILSNFLQSPMIPIQQRGLIRPLLAKWGRINGLVSDTTFIDEVAALLNQMEEQDALEADEGKAEELAEKPAPRVVPTIAPTISPEQQAIIREQQEHTIKRNQSDDTSGNQSSGRATTDFGFGENTDAKPVQRERPKFSINAGPSIRAVQHGTGAAIDGRETGDGRE